jgi:hypothetical protein
MSEEPDPPEIPIVCPACDTRTRVPFPDVEETVERHNAGVHDGEEIAAVDPDVFDQLADYVAADLGLLEE